LTPQPIEGEDEDTEGRDVAFTGFAFIGQWYKWFSRLFLSVWTDYFKKVHSIA